MPAEKRKKPEGLTDDERMAYLDAVKALKAHEAAAKSGGLPGPAGERPAADIVREIENGVARRRRERIEGRPHITVGGHAEERRRPPDAFERALRDLVNRARLLFQGRRK